MDARVILGGVIVAIVAVVVVIAMMPNSGMLKIIMPGGPNAPNSISSDSAQLKPLTVLYNGTTIVSITERDAKLQTHFYISNPNTPTIILEYITYAISANGVVIGHGDVGQKYEGSWQSSYYYPLLTGVASNIGNFTVIKNTGNFPEVWSALQTGNAKISVSGTVYYATKTAFSGNDYTEDFNFTG